MHTRTWCQLTEEQAERRANTMQKRGGKKTVAKCNRSDCFDCYGDTL